MITEREKLDNMIEDVEIKKDKLIYLKEQIEKLKIEHLILQKEIISDQTEILTMLYGKEN